MIVSPCDWRTKGKPIKIYDIEEMILDILGGVDTTNNLALSGGIDSSLMLYFMKQVYGENINTFTIALNKSHPDYVHSEMIAKYFSVNWKGYIPSTSLMTEKGDLPGDEIVREFFNFLKSQGVEKIICCDGIDEYMCGYYEHQNDPSEKTYYKFMRQLKEYHLEPLNKNSGDIKVYLPYLNNRLVLLLSQIPLVDKVDINNRKKIMLQIAEGKLPKGIIQRSKYGFCDAMKIKQ